MFEPAVQSVRLFTEDGLGRVAANCGDISFGVLDASANNPLLAGALAYVEALPPDGGATALRDAEVAWHRLLHAITRPTDAELRCLNVGNRSVDFGRPDVLRIFAHGKSKTFAQRLISLKKQLWREGAIARDFPILKHVFLPMFSTMLSLRGLSVRQR
jgi:hypothetical protein